jgi:protein-S-isoprenylcysteine O-methyltransferase Ste14
MTAAHAPGVMRHSALCSSWRATSAWGPADLGPRSPARSSRQGQVHISIFTLIGGIIVNVAIFGGALFLPAGTLDWWRAWVFLGVVFIGAVASTVTLYRVNRDVLEERFKLPVQEGQPLADKIVVVLSITAFVGLIAFIPLDVYRFHLVAKPGILVSLLGLVFFVAGWWITTLALQENAFAAPVVKHQEARHHTVIDRGVYGVVRHPMYAGTVPLLVGMSLWLESYAAAVLASLPMGMLVLRILVEEQFLRRELPGYDAYTKRVRYRLIPCVW